MNKTLLTLALLLCSSFSFAQQKIKSQAEQVTLFINGAQVTRSQTVTIPSGESVLVFTGLSPYLDAKSIQVRAQGRLTVTGINHRFNHLDSLEQNKQQLTLEQKLVETEQQLKEVQTSQEVLAAETELLKVNCSVGNRNTHIPLTTIKELNDYYSSRLLELGKRKLKQEELQKKLEKEKVNIANELTELGKKKSVPTSEISIKIDAQTAGKGTFTLSYYVRNAGWFPSYDIRSEGLDKPLILSYKANIFQNTGEEWKDVALTLSSSNPNLGNVAPQLKTYWLDFGLSAPTYNLQMMGNTVSGTVMDEKNEPLIGTSVIVEGSTIGTMTDVNGHYSITLPEGKSNLTFSFIGYETQTRRANNNTLNIILKEDRQRLEEVVTVAYGLKGKVSGLSVRNSKRTTADKEVPEEQEESVVMEVEQSQNLLGYEFEIKKTQTVFSDGKPVVTEIGRYELPARYLYRCVPKVDKTVFLMAEATEWNKLNLLEGETNIYFENSYVGKSILNPALQGDTLHFSMGRDNGIRVQRTKLQDYISSKLIGANKVQTMSWKIEVRNTRREAVDLTLQDQVPVSRNSSITVTTEELSQGNIDEATGIVTWHLHLQPGEQKELTLQYKVKFPKGRHLTIN